MLASLALLLPLLASTQVDARGRGGDHYVPHRAKVGPASKRLANPDPEAGNRVGGDHYVPHRAKVGPSFGNARGMARRKAFPEAYAGAGAQANGVLLDERGMPITATTTVVVPATTTETVWVVVTAEPQPTDVESIVPTIWTSGGPSSSDSPLPSASESSITSASDMPVISATDSPVPSASDSASASSSGSDLASVTPSASEVPSSSTSASDVPSSSADTSSSSSVGDNLHVPPPPSSSGSASASTTASGTLSPSHSASESSGHDLPVPVPTPTSAESSSSTGHGHGHHHTSSYDDGQWHESSIDSSTTVWWTPSVAPSSTSLSSSATASSSEIESSATESSSTSTIPSATPSTAPLGKRLMNGYFADWSADQTPPEAVDWNRYDVMDFAFAEPDADGNLVFTQSNSEDLLHRLVKTAHAAGKRVKLSVGGWTGSAHFSPLVKSESSRKVFIDNIVEAIHKFQLDGVDLDWEYPGVEGASGNAVSGDDTANYLVFCQELRAAVPEGSLITAATQVWPFYGPDRQPLDDVSGFAEVFDWILLMNYDIWGSSETPGANAPLSNGCSGSEQPTANAESAVASWVAAGFPANQITLGVPAYGYIQTSSADELVHRRRRNLPTPPHRKRAELTVTNGAGSDGDGQVGFNSLVSQGALSLEDGSYVGSSGFVRNWDECSSTPWLKSESSGQIITYDDPQSMNLKGQFARQAGLLGCSVFSVDGDDLGGSWPLTDAVRSGMGLD